VHQLPRALQNVVDELASLPGLGPKSALRIGLTLLHMPRDRARGLGESIVALRESLCVCSSCGSLSDEEPCSICADPSRSGSVICLVPDWDSLLTVEEAGLFRGKYLVLGGLLSPLEGIQAASLELDRLRRRLSEESVEEVILALGTTRDGETTESYIKNLIHSEYPSVRISRLAQGIPIGSDLKYVDRETLKQSLNFRQALD